MRDCQHGQLARSCHICDLEKENRYLWEELRAIAKLDEVDSYDQLEQAIIIAKNALRKKKVKKISEQ